MPDSINGQAAGTSHRFIVGRDGGGNWIARDEQGQTGGVFSDEHAAIHFAESESNHEPGSVVIAPATMRLSLFS